MSVKELLDRLLEVPEELRDQIEVYTERWVSYNDSETSWPEDEITSGCTTYYPPEVSNKIKKGKQVVNTPGKFIIG